MANFKHFYAADFENTTEAPTHTYAAGIMNVNDEEPHIYDTIDKFMAFLETIPAKSCVFFHNLGYDVFLILYWLLHNGFRQHTTGPFTFSGNYAPDGTFYQLEIRFKRRRVVLRDTAKLLQGSLDSIGRNLKCKTYKRKGTVDYDAYRPVGYKINKTERRYLRADVKLLAEIVLKLQDMGIVGYMTAASFAFERLSEHLYCDAKGIDFNGVLKDKHWKRNIQDNFRKTFPELSRSDDHGIRKAYRGGYCYNNTNGERFNQKGFVVDVNSLYPSVMHDHMYPYGKPVHYDYMPDIKDDEVYFVKINTSFKVKDKHFPFIQIKKGFYNEHEYVKETKEEVTLWLTSVDHKLFHENYLIYYEEIEEVYVFKAQRTLFNNFIEINYANKANAKDPTSKQLAKIILNSSYGKFGQRLDMPDAVITLDEYDIVKLHSVVQTEELDELHNEIIKDQPKSAYIPVAAFVTAYGRDTIIRAAQAVGFDHVKYIDTDSLHLIGISLEEVRNIIHIDQKQLGAFGVEAFFDSARWVRAKTYIEHITHDDKFNETEYYNVKACGLPDGGKKIVKDQEDPLEFFKAGMRLEDAKLMRERCVGGVRLVKRSFEIKIA